MTADVLAPKNPMILGIAGCCARAASGHAAALPRTLMNSRRLMCSPLRPKITSYHILENRVSAEVFDWALA
jgi:hypothetical protein